MFGALLKRFGQIGRCIWIPYAVGTLLFAATAFIGVKKRRIRPAAAVLSFVVFMLSWRLALNIISSRYMLMLLPGAVFCFVAAFAVIGSKVRCAKRIATVLAAALAVYSIAETLTKFNGLNRLAEKLRRDRTAPTEHVIMFGMDLDVERMRKMLPEHGIRANPGLPDAASLARELANAHNFAAGGYVVVKSDSDEHAAYAPLLSGLRPSGELPVGRRKKDFYYLYRYDAVPAAAPAGAVLVADEGFRELLPKDSAQYAKVREFGRASGIARLADGDFSLPRHWTPLGVGGYRRHCDAVLECRIGGKDAPNGMRIAAVSDAPLLYVDRRFGRGAYMVEMKVRGLADTRGGLRGCFYDRNDSFIGSGEFAIFRLGAGQTETMRFLIPESGSPEYDGLRFVVNVASGDLLMENFRVFRLDGARQTQTTAEDKSERQAAK